LRRAAYRSTGTQGWLGSTAMTAWLGSISVGRLRRLAVALAIAAAAVGPLATASPAQAQQAKGKTGQQKAQPKKPVMPTAPQITTAPDTSETVQADLSARTVTIETDFSGTRLILFGAVENSKQTSAEAGLYDIVVVLEGPPQRIAVRRKSRTAGIWINTRSLTLQEVPSYYAIVSTRPIEEVAPDSILDKQEVGFRYVYMEIAPGQGKNPAANELDAFKEALIRLKRAEGLYREDNYGIAFIGKSLFRATIILPANVPVGTFRARVLLFRHGQFLSQYTAPLSLERAGIERVAHGLANGQPLAYGFAAVLIAIALGLLASITLAKREAHG
jgi:uncharacterized protein (TIGR02186 family)